MKFLNEWTHIVDNEKPVDLNDRDSEKTAVQMVLPGNFSDKAKTCWDYFEEAGFIFEYKGHLVVTDESLYLTFYGDGSPKAPLGGPRWICDSWEELERNLEETYDTLVKNGDLVDVNNE